MNGSSRHDDARLETVAVYALGALPEAEALEIAAHIAECPECAREYQELRGAANLVASGAETAEFAPNELQSQRMKNAIMREVRASLQPATPKAEPSALPVVPRVPWLAYLAAAACLTVAFLSTSQLSAVRTQHERDVKQVAQLRAQLDRQQRTEAILAAALQPGADRFPVGLGLVARSNGRIILAMQHMPAPPKGKVYQAWTLRRGAKGVAPSITFTPDASGTLVVELPGPAAGLAAVAVSVEPEGGSTAPTGKPMFVRSLS